ncbi:anti-sigma factor family protein [Sediminibacillus halophilus]|uniref:Crystaline entomocidal protoxin n=1 Tax=Sediminibacillus halophilus TaxID=482461 RepID=A0A1G9TR28_9BACI|nr:zf-HC2 domain-containing protein [Sediminibacillus halophilus]SDM50180.1 Putative zinc-finger [Sediminibacillus halophilus]
MIHIEEELWHYIEETIDDQRQQQIEAHLESCEQCFDHYLALLDQWEPPGHLADPFTESTIDKINVQQVLPRMDRQKNSSSPSKEVKTVSHYLLAAGLTIVLMASGIFQGVLHITDQTSLNSRPSMTDSLMQKTDSWLTQLMKGENQ